MEKMSEVARQRVTDIFPHRIDLELDGCFNVSEPIWKLATFPKNQKNRKKHMKLFCFR